MRQQHQLHGVELYWDHPPAEWPPTAAVELATYTRRLDLDSLLRDVDAEPTRSRRTTLAGRDWAPRGHILRGGTGAVEYADLTIRGEMLQRPPSMRMDHPKHEHRELGRSPRSRRVLALALAASLGLAQTPQAEANVVARRVARAVGTWVLSAIASHGASKIIDHATGQNFEQQLQDSIPYLMERIASATGAEREALQEELDLVQKQLRVVNEVLASQGANLGHLRAEQETLLRRFDELDQRVERLEGQVADLDHRVSQLEDALISECLDRRYSTTLGFDGYRIAETPAAVLEDRYEDGDLSVAARLYLDACTADLTQRGLLIQLSLVTRGLDQEMNLYATIKDVEALAATGRPADAYQRFEFPLERPDLPWHGQVSEVFVPYFEVAYLPAAGRLAVAMVVTHDGQVRYVFTDRVLTCSVGQRTSCRWRH